MNENPKVFSQDFIDIHLAKLPNASTCEVDEIEHQIFEGYDRNSEIRPTHLDVIYLVFIKNETKDGWVFAGYRN